MKRATKRAACLPMAFLLLGGCVEKSEGLTASEREQLKAYLAEEPTKPEHELDVSLEGKIDLLGYDVSKEQWKPGEKLTVTWHWKVNKTLEPGWKLFTHVADASGKDRLNRDSAGPIREMYPPGQWKKGEYIKDEQELALPKDWGSSRAVLYLGIWNGPHRLQVTKGPSDGDNRIRALSIQTPQPEGSDKEPQPKVPSLQARKAEGDIKIDGKLDDEAWKKTPATRRFVNTLSGKATKPKTKARVTWNEEHLYVGFEVADDFLKSTYEEHDKHLWDQDVVEVFADPDGDGKNYFEVQVSPKGVAFDTRYDSRRVPKPVGHVDWSSDVEAKVTTDGDVNDDKPDKGYTVEMAIPWKALKAGDPPASKPSAGTTWRMNFFVMDVQQGDKDRRSGAWSPPRVGDFHVPSRFGKVTFAGGDGEGAKAAEAQKKNEKHAIRPDTVDELRKKLKKRLGTNEKRARRNDDQTKDDKGGSGEQAE